MNSLSHESPSATPVSTADQQRTADSWLDRLRPAHVGLRAELEVSRHLFRGVPTYVLRDPVTFKSHKLSAGDYQIYVSLTSSTSLGKIFAKLCEQNVLDVKQEEAFYRFVLSLAQMGLLSLPVSDGSALYAKYKRQRDAERRAKLLGVLFLQVPLFQPDRFLERTKRFVTPLFSRWAFSIWLLGLVGCILIVSVRWHEFRSPLGSMLTLHNVPLLWSLLVGLKVFHEFGHAYACKRFGGVVPEMGAYFIIFTPCAYVDASASWGFPRPLHRIIVGLGGMYFESILAQLAVLIWALTPHGAVHSAAQYAIILATVVTAGFNANPLMKYDGYYILSDLVGIPNLRQEAQQRVSSLFSRWVLGVTASLDEQPIFTRMFLTAFGLTCSLYKFVVVAGLTVAIAWKLPMIGIVVAAAYLFNTLRQIALGMYHQVQRQRTRPAQVRAAAGLATCLIVACVLVALIPFAQHEHAEGVARRMNTTTVYAQSSGWLTQEFLPEGTAVATGTLLGQLENPELSTRALQGQYDAEQLRISLMSEVETDQSAASIAQQRHQAKLTELATSRDAVAQLSITSPSDGVVSHNFLRHQVGRYIPHGTPVAMVAGGPWVVQTLVSAEQLANLRLQAESPVQILFPAATTRIYWATVKRITQVGSRRINQVALTQLGGGDIAVSVDTGEAEQAYFEITLVLAPNQQADFVRQDMTAQIKFVTQRTTVGRQFYRRLLNLWNQLQQLG
ncbi:MAG: HlyD family efflux transporter periplasmic adaptor subunit [Planctomycetales bacterium]|nr:HlyD family efflux transporter periplasmic adaptor subunit [Planctomycetales bacterium]